MRTRADLHPAPSIALATLLAWGGLHVSSLTGQQPDDLYSIVDLGVLAPEQVSAARAVNSAGQVAGRTGAVNGADTRAAIWSLAGVESLGTLPGGDYSAAFDINDFETVVGTANTDTHVRAFLWTRATGMQALPLPAGDTVSEALALNNAGDVVGCAGGGAPAIAVLWSRFGDVVKLGTLPGGASSQAFAVNEAGAVVGSSDSAAGTRAFLWTFDGGMLDLGTLPGDTASEALAINDLGQVVGYSSARNRTRAFLWTAATGMVNLATLPGGNHSRALGINNAGEIVGTASSNQGTRAVSWSLTGMVRDLHTRIRPDVYPGLILSEAQAVGNGRHVIALSGGGEHADDKDHTDHFYHLFLLTR